MKDSKDSNLVKHASVQNVEVKDIKDSNLVKHISTTTGGTKDMMNSNLVKHTVVCNTGNNGANSTWSTVKRLDNGNGNKNGQSCYNRSNNNSINFQLSGMELDNSICMSRNDKVNKQCSRSIKN